MQQEWEKQQQIIARVVNLQQKEFISVKIIPFILDWLLNTDDPNTQEIITRTKEEISDCKQSVEYHLKPLINKVYARQLAMNAKSTPEEPEIKNASQINQMLSTLDLGGGTTRPHDPLSGGTSIKPEPTQSNVIKRKLKMK